MQRLGRASGTRITVIAGEGLPGGAARPVLAESHDVAGRAWRTIATGRSSRPPCSGGTGKAVRFSHTLDENMMYVAVPVKRRRAARDRRRRPRRRSADGGRPRARSLYWRIGLTAVVVALVAALIGLFVSGRISRQMSEIKEGATAFAAGDFSHKLSVPRTEEFAASPRASTHMADDLDEKIRTAHPRAQRARGGAGRA